MNPFMGLDSATLAELKTEYKNCLIAIATAGQSYSVAGQSFSRPDLETVKRTLGQIQAAIDAQQGRTATRILPNFRP